MAKIVGKDLKEVHKITCKQCASIVEYVKNEVQETHGTDYGGGSSGARWVKCPNPVCQKDIIIESW